MGNSSMSPPWRMDPMTHCTTSKRSHHGATSRSKDWWSMVWKSDIYENLQLGTAKPYLRAHILSSFGHARSQAQPLAWPVTLSTAGKSTNKISPFYRPSPSVSCFVVITANSNSPRQTKITDLHLLRQTPNHFIIVFVILIFRLISVSLPQIHECCLEYSAIWTV